MHSFKANILALILLFFLVESSFAQVESKLSGVVIENGSKNRIALAVITNLRNHYSVGSNDMGIFEIKAALFDTLVISKRGFTDKALVVVSNKDLIVYLNGSNTLNEVVITGQSKRQVMDEIKHDFKNKGSFYAGKPSPLLFLFKPLTAIYETFGRTPRNARRFSNYYDTELQQSHIDKFFNRTLINQYTGLEGKALDDFMINYRPDYEVAKNWNVYDGTKWIKDSFKKYGDSVKR